MKIKILEYHRYKAGIIKVQSHNKHNGKWKVNPRYSLHKMLIENTIMYPIESKKEYSIERK